MEANAAFLSRASSAACNVLKNHKRGAAKANDDVRMERQMGCRMPTCLRPQTCQEVCLPFVFKEAMAAVRVLVGIEQQRKIKKWNV
jgi:hypothetical protein